MALSTDQLTELLSEPHVTVIAIPREGRAPLATPVWYDRNADGELWIVVERDSAKARLLAVGAQASLCIERERPTVRYATAEATVARIEAAQSSDEATLAHRYLPTEAADGYLAQVNSMDRDLVTIAFTVDRWIGLDMGSFS